MFSSDLLQVKKMVKCFHRKYIKKYHSFILCKHERGKAIRLDLLLQGTPTTYCCTPFGAVSGAKYNCFDRPTEFAMDVIRALIHLHDLVHSSEYSFDGQLPIENLYWIPETKSIKIAGLTIGEMVKKTDKRIKSDFKCQHNLIRDKVFSGSNVPRELRHLLRLMISDPIQYRSLITHNICLLDDEEKLGRYTVLYQKLGIIKKMDRKLFQKALSYVTCGVCYPWHNWKWDVYLNEALISVYEYRNIPDYYTEDAEGVAWFGRNCCGHLTDGSVRSENGGDIAIMYTCADIFPMVECYVPGLFSQVEEGVFEVVKIHNNQKLQCLVNKATGGV